MLQKAATLNPYLGEKVLTKNEELSYIWRLDLFNPSSSPAT